MDPDNYYFYVKINDGYTLKILVDILHISLKDICLDLSDAGINLSMMDTRKQILFALTMFSGDFQPYVYNYPSANKQIGINGKYLHSMIHSIKRKDKLILSIKKSDPYILNIDHIPKDMNKMINSAISIANHQNVTISEIPQGYDKFIFVSTQDYQKMIKELGVISNKISVKSSVNHIQFGADMPQVFNKSVVFGDPSGAIILFSEEFSTEYLLKIIKISGINKNMKIYTAPGSPLHFSLGLFDSCKLSIYIKPE